MPLQSKVMLVRGKPFRVSTSISVGGGGRRHGQGLGTWVLPRRFSGESW